jgi:hypothetical protein
MWKYLLIGAVIPLTWALYDYVEAQVAKDQAEALAVRAAANLEITRFNNEVRQRNREREQDESDRFFQRGKYA